MGRKHNFKYKLGIKTTLILKKEKYIHGLVIYKSKYQERIK